MPHAAPAGEELGHAARLPRGAARGGAVAPPRRRRGQRLDPVPDLHFAARHAAGDEPADERVVLDHGHEESKRICARAGRRGRPLPQRVEQRGHVPRARRFSPSAHLSSGGQVVGADAGAGGRVDDGEVQLLVARAHRGE